MPKQKKGIFIVLEGIEGSGKTTQAKLLTQRLRKEGLEVVSTREPGGTLVGKKIRNILKDPNHTITPLAELFLFLADRAQHIVEVIQTALQEGKIVISDRFYPSTLAYQQGGRELDPSWVKKLNDLLIRNCKPDLVIILERDIRQALKGAQQVSGEEDRFEQEDLTFHQKVRQVYRELAKENPRVFRLIKADLPIQEVHKKIWREVKEIL